MCAVINGFIDMENVRCVFVFFSSCTAGKAFKHGGDVHCEGRAGLGRSRSWGSKRALRVRERSVSVTPIEQPELQRPSKM